MNRPLALTTFIEAGLAGRGAPRHSGAGEVAAQERMRREIAAHLHGPVQGRLLALRAQLEALAAGSGISAEASGRLRAVSDQMELIIRRDIAGLSRHLYPAIIRRGLVPSLQSLLDRFETVLSVRFECAEELARRERDHPDFLPETTRLMAYRIAEEALTNVLKHASESRVSVEVEEDSDGWLTLAVRDDGPGFEMDQRACGMGLAAMHDYAEAAGGSCFVISSRLNGTSVMARLPVRAGETQSTER